MQNRHLGGDGFAGGAADDAGNIIIAPNVIRFHRACRPPLTLSQIVARYSARRCPRGQYRTPMPDDYREAR